MDHSQDNNIIGRRIRETRLQLGLTQEQLGERAGVHYSYIGQIERGHKNPSLATLRKIAAALNISVDFLVGNAATDEMSPQKLLVGELTNLVNDCPPADLRLFIDLIRLMKTRLAH